VEWIVWEIQKLIFCQYCIDQCKDAQDKATVKNFSSAAVVASENLGPDPQFPDFDLICDA
jgi:hypothetical protein